MSSDKFDDTWPNPAEASTEIGNEDDPFNREAAFWGLMRDAVLFMIAAVGFALLLLWSR
jgi:hypothetical protein